MQEFIRNFRGIFKLILWVMLVLAMWTGNYQLSILNGVVIAILELEEINEKLD